MDKILHHFETMKNHGRLVFTLIPGVQDFVHPRYGENETTPSGQQMILLGHNGMSKKWRSTPIRLTIRHPGVRQANMWKPHFGNATSKKCSENVKSAAENLGNVLLIHWSGQDNVGMSCWRFFLLLGSLDLNVPHIVLVIAKDARVFKVALLRSFHGHKS